MSTPSLEHLNQETINLYQNQRQPRGTSTSTRARPKQAHQNEAQANQRRRDATPRLDRLEGAVAPGRAVRAVRNYGARRFVACWGGAMASVLSVRSPLRPRAPERDPHGLISLKEPLVPWGRAR